MSTETPDELRKVYSRRFAQTRQYRDQVWQVLTREFFQRWVPQDGVVLDLGCGYGEFINNIHAAKKFGMDLNPDTRQHLGGDVVFLEQDCSAKWHVEERSLDVVFTSNFLEHLREKPALDATMTEAYRCLKPGGRLIAMGPNIRFLPGEYWDFWDHYLALTELSLAEALEIRGFAVEMAVPRFLPYTMVGGPRYPLFFVSIYLRMRPFWRVKGKQFLVVARKPQ